MRLESSTGPNMRSAAFTVTSIALLGALAVACASSDSTPGAEDADYTSAKVKSPAKKADSSKQGPAVADANTGAGAPAAGESCYGKCLAASPASKKILDDDTACISKCGATSGPSSSSASRTNGGEGGGDGEGASDALAAEDSCTAACDRSLEQACTTNKAACAAIDACDVKCGADEAGPSGGSASLPKDEPTPATEPDVGSGGGSNTPKDP